MPTRKSVGVIGLGFIGGGLARNLVKAGFDVYVYDIDSTKRQALVDDGAVAVSGPGDMAAKTDRVVLSLMHAAVVETVLFGEGGLAGAAREGLLVVDTTTESPEESRAIAARLSELGIGYLDSPVTGGAGGADAGTLSLMVGGSSDAFESCADIFDAVSSKCIHVGECGAGAAAKMVNQLLMCAQIASAAESMVYCEKQQVDFDRVVQAINPQLQENMWLRTLNDKRHEAQEHTGDRPTADTDHYTPLFVKDMRCMLQLGATQPVAEAVLAMVASAVEHRTDGPFVWSVKTGLDALNSQGASETASRSHREAAKARA